MPDLPEVVRDLFGTEDPDHAGFEDVKRARSGRLRNPPDAMRPVGLTLASIPSGDGGAFVGYEGRAVDLTPA